MHALVLGLALVAFFTVTAPLSVYTSDEGAYALQAASLRDGHWSYDYKLAGLDPTGERFPLVNSVRDGNGTWYTYPHHPLWPLALAATTSALGERVGLHILELLAVVGVACMAWLLTAELEPTAARAGFWLAAASPVFVNGYLTWAHTPSALMAGVALLMALRIGRDRASLASVAVMSGAVVLGVLLRAEGIFVAPAAAAVILAMSRRVRLVALTPIAFGAVTYLGERAWVHRIVRGGGYTAPDRTAGESLIAGRLKGAWHLLFAGSYRGQAVALFALAALVILAVATVRSGEDGAEDAADDRPLVAAAIVATVLLAARWAMGSGDAITGLLVAWPVVVVGALRALRRPTTPTLALVAGIAVFVAPVLATQYAESGGLEWGGRYLSPIIVPLAAVAAAGFVRLGRRPAIALAVVAAMSASMALGIVTNRRRDHDRLIAAIAARHPGVVVTDLPALPRLAWRTHRDTAWWLAKEGEVDAAVADLQRAGKERIVTVTSKGIKNIRSK